jgi:hypothetical protein
MDKKFPKLKEIVPNASIFLQQAVKEQSELGWGKEIITLSHKFVLDSWYVRNEKEHDNIGDSIGKANDKIVE